MSADPYRLSIAAIAVTFVGLSSLVITLRQAAGGSISRFDAFLMRNFIQLGFMVTAGALLPPLLDLTGLQEGLIWRFGSAAVAIPALVFAATYPHRRHKASGRDMPFAIWLDVLILFSVGVALALNASGALFPPSAVMLADGLTVMLFLSGLAYLQALDLLLREHVSTSKRK